MQTRGPGPEPLATSVPTGTLCQAARLPGCPPAPKGRGFLCHAPWALSGLHSLQLIIEPGQACRRPCWGQQGAVALSGCVTPRLGCQLTGPGHAPRPCGLAKVSGSSVQILSPPPTAARVSPSPHHGLRSRLGGRWAPDPTASVHERKWGLRFRRLREGTQAGPPRGQPLTVASGPPPLTRPPGVHRAQRLSSSAGPRTRSTWRWAASGPPTTSVSGAPSRGRWAMPREGARGGDLQGLIAGVH